MRLAPEWTDQHLVLRTEAVANYPQVLTAGLNTTQVDPPDLPVGRQPTNWDQQRSQILEIQVAFDQAMNISSQDLVLTNMGVNAPQDADTVTEIGADQIHLDGSVLTITFAPLALSDGVYQLEILPTASSMQGQPLDGDGDGLGGDAFVWTGDASNRFYVLAAEWNGDLGVTIFDFPVFAYWFARPVPTSPSYVDLNADGGVSIFDFPMYGANFTKHIAYPAGLQPLLPETPIPSRAGPLHSAILPAGSAVWRRAASAGRAAAAPVLSAERPQATSLHDAAMLELLASWREGDFAGERVELDQIDRWANDRQVLRLASEAREPLLGEAAAWQEELVCRLESSGGPR